MTVKIFLTPNFKIYSFEKKFQWQSSLLVHRVLTKLFRLSDGLVKRLFCRADIWRIELKSSWTVGKRLLASDQEATVGLIKWLERKGNWVVPSLSYNLQKFIGSSFKICLSWKKCSSVWTFSGWCHVSLRELFRLSYVLANRSFCGPDISRVQLKPNCTVDERLLSSDQEAVRKCRLILLKRQ